MHSPVLNLLHWYSLEGRSLPWRETRNPYHIWLSEVILQQTRIDQGTAYYLRFLEQFPTVTELANAEPDTVMKLWEGLGYYARARNLHAAAKQVVADFNGQFPDTFQALEKLKGIGPYTARAIGSIAFDNPVGVLDGNVFRVLSRYLGDFRPVDVPATRHAFQAILDNWIAHAGPSAQGRSCAADFNQAMMDLGAMICTPRKPLCGKCPLQSECVAFRDGVQEGLPVKGKKAPRRTVYQHFFLAGKPGQTLVVQQRPPSGIWGNLWEIPNQEVDMARFNHADLPGYELMGAFKHVFTHLDMHIKVYKGLNSPLEPIASTTEIALRELAGRAFSRAVLKIFERYLEQES